MHALLEVQCSALSHSTVQCCKVQCSVVLNRAVLTARIHLRKDRRGRRQPGSESLMYWGILGMSRMSGYVRGISGTSEDVG